MVSEHDRSIADPYGNTPPTASAPCRLGICFDRRSKPAALHTAAMLAHGIAGRSNPMGSVRHTNHQKRGCLTKRQLLKITKPGSCTESDFGVLFRCERKQNAGRVYSIRDWISSLLAHEFRNYHPVGRTSEIAQRCCRGVGLQ